MGSPVEHDPPRYRRRVARIRALAPEVEALGNAGLRAEALNIVERRRGGAPIEDRLELSFALVAEACRRALALSPYDEQLVAALAMHDGHIAQMDTGEGKTLAAVFPAFVWGASGRGVHVLTFNDYLARRDAAWMRTAPTSTC